MGSTLTPGCGAGMGVGGLLMEIVSRALNDVARPIDSDQSQGRFLARFEGFLDPAIYSKGRDVTVVGTLNGQQTRTINGYQYRYPMVDVESYDLWRPLPENRLPPLFVIIRI